MYRIKISGNFFVILNDSDQSEFARHPLKDCDYEQFEDLTTNPLYRFTGIMKSFGTKNASKTEFRFSELLDVNGVVFASILILNALLDKNLGKSSGGVNGIGVEVNTFLDLPDVALNIGITIPVLTQTGSWLLGTKKQSGFYRSDGTSWILRNDVNSLLIDTEFNIRDDVDNSKGISFNLNTLSTGSIKQAIWQDKNGVIAYLEDVFTWNYYVSTWSTSPTLNTTLTSGEVFNYNLKGVIKYRFVPTIYNPTQDAFYSNFDGLTLTGLIITRG